MRPVIVVVLKSEAERVRDLELEAAAVFALVAQVLCRRTQNVQVIYVMAARGMVAFGGKLVR
jgi:hypothetical protein